MLRGVSFGARRRHRAGPARPQRHGQDDADPHADGLCAGRPGQRRVARPRRDRCSRPSAWRGWASATCPRAAASSRTCRCARTCVMRRAPASTAGATGPSSACSQTFPRLAERLGHGGQQLSGGEQQMLSIGRALMTNPQLLILDEATEGLAPLIVAEIWRVDRRDPRDRHQHADRRPQLPRGARPHRSRGRAGKRPDRDRRRLRALARDGATLSRYLGV